MLNGSKTVVNVMSSGEREKIVTERGLSWFLSSVSKCKPNTYKFFPKFFSPKRSKFLLFYFLCRCTLKGVV